METLELVCRDAFLNLPVTPSYSVFADTDIITRSVRVENCGEQHLKLEKAYSTCLDMDNRDFEMLTLVGSWARERHIQRGGLRFGKRNLDDSSLGDWTVNEEKITSGLPDLVEKINKIGLQFGIRFEPEMISPDSDLYRAHPDWAIRIAGRTPSQSRAQYVLELSRYCGYLVPSKQGDFVSRLYHFVRVG